MKVVELMTRNVHACSPIDSLNRAAQIMWEHDCGCVPVTDANSFVVGMVTDRDICMAAYTQGKALGEIPVLLAMSDQVFACTEDESVEQAESLMRQKQVRRLPVTDLSGRLVGILSLNDITQHLSAERSGRADGISSEAIAKTLADIGKPCEARPSE